MEASASAIETPTVSSPESLLSTIRFDLSGDPIPPDLVAILPTQLGLHHHGDSSELAGYTLADLFLLSRSTVPNQRTIVLKALTGLLSNLQRRNGRTTKGVEIPDVLLKGREWLKDAVVGVAAHAFLDGRGMTLISAVDLLWEGLVAWDISFLDLDDEIVVEAEERAFTFNVPQETESLTSQSDTTSQSAVALNHILIVTSNIINTTAPPPDTSILTQPPSPNSASTRNALSSIGQRVPESRGFNYRCNPNLCDGTDLII